MREDSPIMVKGWICPSTRNCIQDKKNVHHKLSQALQDMALQDRHKSYTGVVS